MILRIADNCYWMFRYLERCESLTRALRASYLIDLDIREQVANQESFLLTLSQEKQLFLQMNGGKSIECELLQHFMVWQELNCNCLQNALKSTRENAQLIREIISESMWQVINRLHLWISSEGAEQLYTVERYVFYSQILDSILLLKGYFYDACLRDDYFHMMEFGLHFERSQQVFNLLDKLNETNLLAPSLINRESEEQFTVLSFLLECFSSQESYLKQEKDFTPESLAQYFLNNAYSPYSLRQCLERCFISLSSLSGKPRSLQNILNRLQETIHYIPQVKLTSLLKEGSSPEKGVVKTNLNAISNALQATFERLAVN